MTRYFVVLKGTSQFGDNNELFSVPQKVMVDYREKNYTYYIKFYVTNKMYFRTGVCLSFFQRIFPLSVLPFLHSKSQIYISL